MKVKVTKVMAKDLAENLSGEYNIKYVEMPAANYRLAVGDIWDNEQDYNPRRGVFAAIRVDYPAERYAMPRYLTTRDLLEICHESDKSYNGFMNAVGNALAI